MMPRHANSSIYRLRPNHGIAFIDIEISASQLARVKACFVEEKLSTDTGERSVLLPVGTDGMFDGGGVWHPETFQPLGPNDAIWLSGHQGLSPFIGHWLPLPYLRLMTSKPGADTDARRNVDQGPLNWVRVFISPPEGELHEASVLKAVLAIDTQIADGSRLDQRRYNTPSADDVQLGSTFVLTDDADQLAGLLTEPWLNAWLLEILTLENASGDRTKPDASSFEQEHIARYLFLLRVLCEACPAPILRFVSHARERIAIDAAENELILDLSDDVGLAVLVGQQSTAQWSADRSRSRVLPLRDLGLPTNIYSGPLPVRIEFDTAPFGFSQISRQSGRSNAFNWGSLVRIGEEASRISLRPNAELGTTGAAALARHVRDIAPIDGMWRSSSDNAEFRKFGPPARNVAMQHLTENGALVGTGDNMQPALRPRFSRSSLLTLFIAELVLHTISVLNEPRKSSHKDAAAAASDYLKTLRLSLPVSVDDAERESILARTRDSIDFIWRAQGWDDDASGQAPPKPDVVLGLGGDFGVQLIYLHNQLSDIYGGDLPALIEDLNPVRKPTDAATQIVQFTSVAIGFAATRIVAADYHLVDSGGIRPRLVGTETIQSGIDSIHQAVIDRYLVPAIGKALKKCGDGGRNSAPAIDTLELLGRSPSDRHSAAAERRVQLETKILLPAARTLLDIYASSPPGGARGVELFTLADLVERGRGRLGPLTELIDADADEMGATSFRLADATIPYSRHTFRRVALGALETLLAEACSNINAAETDLIFVTSTYACADDVRDLILSLVPISPHRLIVLDENWSDQPDRLGLPAQLSVPVRIGVLSAVIGQQQMLDYHGLASFEQTIQLESEVA